MPTPRNLRFRGDPRRRRSRRQGARRRVVTHLRCAPSCATLSLAPAADAANLQRTSAPGHSYTRSLFPAGQCTMPPGARSQERPHLKIETGEHPKPRSQYADEAVQLAIAGKWDEAVKLNRTIIEDFGADEETQNRLGKALSELGKLKDAKAAYEAALKL